MAAVDHNKRKIKSESDSENLFEALKDEKLETLPKHYHERSSILIKPT